jgi:hypothetical protein
MMGVWGQDGARHLRHSGRRSGIHLARDGSLAWGPRVVRVWSEGGEEVEEKMDPLVKPEDGEILGGG